jgi:transcriptional regulator with XRE-family HTH domain
VGLREIREGKVLTQRELAATSGVSPTTIINIEAGRIRPHPGTLRKLAKALEMPVQDLAAALRSGEQSGEAAA